MKKLLLLLPIAFLFIGYQKEVIFDSSYNEKIPSNTSGRAVYKLSGSGSTCPNFVLKGVYEVGKAMIAGDSVTLQVTVDTLGTYSLTTNKTNGISFISNGAFTKTGMQTITLTGTGTPKATGDFIYKPSIGTGCTFTVTVKANTASTNFYIQ